MRKYLIIILTLLLLLSGCASENSQEEESIVDNSVSLDDLSSTDESEKTDGSATADTEMTEKEADDYFTKRDFNYSYTMADATKITLSDQGSSISGSGAAVFGNTIVISLEGVYYISGSLEDGHILVDAAEDAKIQLVLHNVSLASSDYPALYVKSAKKVFLTLEGSNDLSDGEVYHLEEEDGNLDACIFSRADLCINGSGSLNVTGNYKHGIVSKDDLKVTGGTITVTARKAGIEGKDSVRIGGGTITVSAGSDGIRSTNDEKDTKGYVYIADGTLDISSNNDGIQAETDIIIEGGQITVYTASGAKTTSYGGGVWGYGNSANEESAKGIKAEREIILSGGRIDINSTDDSLHCNGNITVNDVTLSVQSGDDGIHADDSLTINNGKITITKSYEGLEATDITINGGDISITASDDGINAAGQSQNDGYYGYGRPGQNSFSSESGTLMINGGTIWINADGDGVDSNGTLSMSGGEVVVFGPTNSANGALDYGSAAEISGGTVIALGATGMAENFTSARNQGSFLVNTGSQRAGSTVEIYKDGQLIYSVEAQKSFGCLVFSSPEVESGHSYSVYVNAAEAASLTLDTLIYNGINGFGGGMMPGGGFNNGGSFPGGFADGEDEGDFEGPGDDGFGQGEIPEKPGDDGFGQGGMPGGQGGIPGGQGGYPGGNHGGPGGH